MRDSSERQLDRTMQLDRSTVAEHMRKANVTGKRKPCFIILGGLDVGSVFLLPEMFCLRMCSATVERSSCIVLSSCRSEELRIISVSD